MSVIPQRGRHIIQIKGQEAVGAIKGVENKWLAKLFTASRIEQSMIVDFFK